jgi:dipeptidyl aminopeptidase/acylaminoacyl peptidase
MCGTASRHDVRFDDFQLLAAKGYAVACPEMPIPPLGRAADWRTELPKGVFGAIDKLVDLGIADPKRVAVMGHSFGGFAVLSLISLTNRFQAAVALAPISDFLSEYGSFTGLRYFDGAQERMYGPVNAELWQWSLGSTPWDDMQEYIHNSPVTYLNRVQTPTMLVHGDLDNLSIQQSEEFFTGLYRLGKRAEFVRYWGEAHAIGSPSNIRDLWKRIYAWFDEFCDISRDDSANLVFDGDHVKSRNGAPPLKPEDFARFDQSRK